MENVSQARMFKDLSGLDGGRPFAKSARGRYHGDVRIWAWFVILLLPLAVAGPSPAQAGNTPPHGGTAVAWP